MGLDENKDKLMATDMDFFQRSIFKSRSDRVRNSKIRMSMDMDQDISDDVQRKQ